MKLVIAEKPSVAMSIATVLGADKKQDGYTQGNGYIVSWCVGHLVELAGTDHYGDYQKWRYEDLPILPQVWQLVVSKGKERQFELLKKLMHRADVTSLICATDAGREGELIFRYVYELAACKKPFERLWISSMEETAIGEGFSNLKDGRNYDALYRSALCRSKADWLIGINATRLFSVLYYKKLNVGRVQTPTLAMLVDRNTKITEFKKEKYYRVRLTCDGLQPVSDNKIPTKQEAQALQEACINEIAVCESFTCEKKTQAPPKLFDLTTLQREANRLYGYTAQQTLDLAQTLYEKKLLTYPRTDSRYLTTDMEQTAAIIVSGLCEQMSQAHFAPNLGRVLNNTKVSDHHGIIPTIQAINTVPSLSEREQKLMNLVGVKLLCAVSEPQEYEIVKAVLSCAGQHFTAKGKTIIQDGFTALEATLSPKEPLEERQARVPSICQGQTFKQVDAAVTEHTTAPHKHYTEDTLLSAMEHTGEAEMPEDAERKGIGTPATRAATIEKLVASGFAARKGKNLVPTKDGINLISVLPEVLTSSSLTTDWEQRLTSISKGIDNAEDFMQDITDMTMQLVKENTPGAISVENRGLFHERVEIGKCPRCGKSIFEGRENYYCANKECSFSMWKNDMFFSEKKKVLTKEVAGILLKNEKVKMKGLFSKKTGKTYDATVLLVDTGKYVNYKLKF